MYKKIWFCDFRLPISQAPNKLFFGYEAEYFVPLEYGADAILAVSTLSNLLANHNLYSTIRSVAPDEHWMSPCYKKACLTLNFEFTTTEDQALAAMAEVEKVLEPYGAVPHWGKSRSGVVLTPEIIRARFPMLSKFRELVKQFDPEVKFRNNFLNSYIY